MKRRLAVLLAVAAVGALALPGCFPTEPHIFRYTVGIDSFVVRDTAGVNDTLFVGLRGIIATDGCGAFESLARTRSGGNITYTVTAVHNDVKLCIESLVLLDKIDTVLPPQVGPTVLNANQPKGAFPTTRTVVIK